MAKNSKYLPYGEIFFVCIKISRYFSRPENRPMPSNIAFKLQKCSHTGSQIRKGHSMTCNKCSHTEQATANTLFHKVKFDVRKAFLSVLRCQLQIKA